MGVDPSRCAFSSSFTATASYAERAQLIHPHPRTGLVVEDAPSGAKSGLAAGCKVLGVGTGHDGDALRAVSVPCAMAQILSFR